jgi:hypothetical protein
VANWLTCSRAEVGSFAIWQSKTRIAIGFCLIRRSSASPIVAVHQPNQVSGPHSIGMPRRFLGVPWTNERRVGISRRSSFGGPGIEDNMARLILNCEGVGLVMRELGRDIVMIGRAPSNHIVIDHPTVSAQHAVLLRVRDSYWLKDLNSTNGTQINGNFVTDAELKEGDTIRFGSVIAVFARGDRKPWSSRGIRWIRISS